MKEILHKVTRGTIFITLTLSVIEPIKSSTVGAKRKADQGLNRQCSEYG